jgi:hypothetical protein
MSIRLAAAFAAALLCACSAPKAAATSGSPSASPSAAVAAPSVSPSRAASAHGPMNSPVSRAGAPGQVPLDAAGRREVAAAAAKVPPAERARLRYALATGDDGRQHLVVYDGEGLSAAGRGPGRGNNYVVFRVLNANGEHYDPEQNTIVAPIPPPPERDAAPAKP